MSTPRDLLNALTIMPEWNYTIRLYRPRASIPNGTWIAPRPEAV